MFVGPVLLPEGFAARELRRAAETLFDAQQLIIFGDSISTAGGAGLDLAGVGRNREIR